MWESAKDIRYCISQLCQTWPHTFCSGNEENVFVPTSPIKNSPKKETKKKKRHRSIKIPNSLLALNADLSVNVIKCEQHLNKGEGLRLFKYQGLSLTATPSKAGNFIGCNISVMTRDVTTAE